MTDIWLFLAHSSSRVIRLLVMDTGSIASWDTRRVSIGAVIKEQSVRWPGVSISECITDMSAVLSSLPYPPTQNSYHNYFLGYNDNDEVSHKNSCTFLLCGITVRLQSRNQCCLRWRVAKLKVSITYSADFGNAMLNCLNESSPLSITRCAALSC